MHTPNGFSPAHVLPSPLPPGTLAFAYREAKLAVSGSDDAPTVPTLSALENAGLTGRLHYLGELNAVACVAVTLPESVTDDAVDASILQFAGLRSLFFKLPEPLLALAGRAFQIVEWDRTH